jgi:hypothetical protein
MGVDHISSFSTGLGFAHAMGVRAIPGCCFDGYGFTPALTTLLHKLEYALAE